MAATETATQMGVDMKQVARIAKRMFHLAYVEKVADISSKEFYLGMILGAFILGRIRGIEAEAFGELAREVAQLAEEVEESAPPEMRVQALRKAEELLEQAQKEREERQTFGGIPTPKDGRTH